MGSFKLVTCSARHPLTPPIHGTIRAHPIWPRHNFGTDRAGKYPAHKVLLGRSERARHGSTLIFANARGSGLTHYGVRYLLHRYVAKGARLAPTLKDKNLHPHSS